jgi:hypothetical protein
VVEFEGMRMNRRKSSMERFLNSVIYSGVQVTRVIYHIYSQKLVERFLKVCRYRYEATRMNEGKSNKRIDGVG